MNRTRRFVATSLLAAVGWTLLTAGSAAAGRFGPPWQARVVVDRGTLFEQPDRSARVLGSVERGEVVAVTGQQHDTFGQDWTSTPGGYLVSEDVAEFTEPWVAEVTPPQTPVFAKPNAGDAVRMVVSQGALLRVTGVSPGLQGDTHLWWSTNEGYVAREALQPSQDAWSTMWSVPDGVLAVNGWWGAASSEANVRAGPSTDAPTVGHLGRGQRVKVLVEGPGEYVQGSATWLRIDGGRYAGGWVHSSLIRRTGQPRANTTPPEGGSQSGRWIVVDRRNHSLTLVDHGEPAFVTYVALGVAGRETPTGTYSTWGKYRADDMTSSSVRDPGGYYDLPNVPYTQYYLDGGFAIHGTYWHDDFGADESHGCVNVTWTDGGYLFTQTEPFVPDGQNSTRPGQPATEVVILP